MTIEEQNAYKTLRKYGIECRCESCDFFGCKDCILCFIEPKEAIELANKLAEISQRTY
jgi:hypothetical protein